MMSTEQELTIATEEKKYIDAIFWGGAILWAGLVFGADALGYLPQIGDAIDWSWVFLGVGVYGLLLDFIRLLSTNLSNPTAWVWIWAFIFLVLGAAGLTARARTKVLDKPVLIGVQLPPPLVLLNIPPYVPA